MTKGPQLWFCGRKGVPASPGGPCYPAPAGRLSQCLAASASCESVTSVCCAVQFQSTSEPLGERAQPGITNSPVTRWETEAFNAHGPPHMVRSSRGRIRDGFPQFPGSHGPPLERCAGTALLSGPGLSPDPSCPCPPAPRPLLRPRRQGRVGRCNREEEALLLSCF